MSLDIIESLQSAFGGPLLRQISGSLGESEVSTHSAMNAIGPTIVAGLIHQARSPAGAANLFRAVNDDTTDAGVVGKLAGVFGNRGSLDALTEQGESLGATVFGSHAGALTSAISQVSGVKPGTALRLLSIGLPVVFGILRKYVSQHGLSSSAALASLLMGQGNSLRKAGLDNRITNALGFGNLSSLLGTSPDNAALPAHARPETRERRAGKSWLPWAVAAGVAALGLTLLLNRTADRTDVAPVASTPTSPSAGEQRTRLASASTRVYFGSGETGIDSEDRRKIADIAQSAKDRDRAVAVTGYTDRSGDPSQNLELAQDRAVAVRDALVAEGVDQSKIVMDPPAVVTGTGTEAEARRVDVEVR